LVPERLREQHRRHRVEYFRAPRSRPIGIGLNLVGLRKDGTEIPVELSLNLVKSEGRKLVSGFITDISERLALEREARVSEMSSILGAMAGGVVHELNNPIGIIISRIELMLVEWNAYNLPDQLREDLEAIHRNAQRIGRISQGLLGLIREPSKERRLVNLNSVVEDSLVLVRRQFNKQGVQIETTLDRQLPPILGDPNAIEQVLMNLLVNAREAMPDGGRIGVETSVTSDRPGWLSLSVSNTGGGIQPTALPKLFDLLYTTKGGGTGLGLWISRRIITDHQGFIDARSEPAEGTKFIVLLPAAEGELSA
jgi:signal transduction histidine kinase